MTIEELRSVLASAVRRAEAAIEEADRAALACVAAEADETGAPEEAPPDPGADYPRSSWLV